MFVSLDLVLFYVFWEVMLIPMYFLIGVWGGERRIYAAIKFFIYTMVGSLLMLGAASSSFTYPNGADSFDLVQITQRLAAGRLSLFARRRNSCSSWRSSWPSPSRCPCSRSTPGCRTRTSRRRPLDRSSWPACC